MSTQEPDNGDFPRDEVIAGEYVLGVLSADDRRKVEARLSRDSNFAAMVNRWQDNLASFDDEYETMAPPPRVLSAIEQRLFPAETKPAGGFASVWNSLLLWRGLSIASLGAIAAFLVVDGGYLQQRPTSTPLVAEMKGEGSSITLVAQYDGADGRLKVTPVAARETEERSLELWLIEGSNPPISLGVLPQTGEGELVIDPKLRPKLGAGAVLAVSLEPFGGSPTGQATGPVLALGEARNL